MEYMEQMNSALGMDGLMNICVTLVCIGVSWWALQAVRFEVVVKEIRGAKAKVLQILLSIALGYQTGRFVMDYFEWSSWLPGMF